MITPERAKKLSTAVNMVNETGKVVAQTTKSVGEFRSGFCQCAFLGCDLSFYPDCLFRGCRFFMVFRTTEGKLMTVTAGRCLFFLFSKNWLFGHSIIMYWGWSLLKIGTETGQHFHRFSQNDQIFLFFLVISTSRWFFSLYLLIKIYWSRICTCNVILFLVIQGFVCHFLTWCFRV